MKAKLVSVGEIDIEGKCYDFDVVIERGKVRKRNCKPSKVFREDRGHTPVTSAEHIPWHGKTLYIGTGVYGSLPVMPEVYRTAQEKGVEVIARPTIEVCRYVEKRKSKDVNAILHVTS